MGANKKSNFQKCGNILIDIKTLTSQDKNFAITCVFCNAEYDQIRSFSLHLEKNHSQHFAVELDQATDAENNISLPQEQEAIKLDNQLVINVAKDGGRRNLFTLNESNVNPLESGPSYETRSVEEIVVTPLKREYDDSFDNDEEIWDLHRNKRSHNSPRVYSDEEMDIFQKAHYNTKEKEYPTRDDISGNSKNFDGELPSTKMCNEHTQPFQGRIKDLHQQVNPKCSGCKEFSKKFDIYTDTAQKQYNNLVEILAQHKILLDRIVNQNAIGTTKVGFFPINSEEKLKEFDDVLATQGDPYVRQIKSLLSGNAERNLHQIFGFEIIMNFNVDGSRGKKRLRDFENVYAAMIDVISTFSEASDKTLRAAFQRQKKKYFKQTSRSKAKNQDQSRNESDSSEKED